MPRSPNGFAIIQLTNNFPKSKLTETRREIAEIPGVSRVFRHNGHGEDGQLRATFTSHDEIDQQETSRKIPSVEGVSRVTVPRLNLEIIN